MSESIESIDDSNKRVDNSYQNELLAAVSKNKLFSGVEYSAVNQNDRFESDINFIINNNNNNNNREVNKNRNRNRNPSSNANQVTVVSQLKCLAEAFAKRGEEVKRRISEPLETSSPEESICSEKFGKLLIEEEWMQNMDITRVTQLKKTALRELWHKLRRRELGVFEPQSSIYISWLFLVSLAFGYNAVIIFLRSVFPYETHNNRHIYFIFDYICDAIYAMDMIWFKMRLKYVLDGQWIEESELTRKHYIRRNRFLMDLLSLLPLDLLYLKYGFDKPLLRLVRLNRLFKIQTFWEFFTRIDAITKFPYFLRIIHTLIYKIYLIHLSTCAYYLMSYYEGFGSTQWTYNNRGNAYLRCFYFAFRTATSIGGRMPKPSNQLERVYMIISWLMGVFVFALLIGQIRDIVATATQNKTHYRNVVNQTVRYMRNLCLPHGLQKRVRQWLTFTWAQQKTFDENKILELLPLKMRTDLALSIHYHTLSRVDLFRNCDRTLLRDLVLKFQSVLFLPGDYICRKGEIGHEMYIVNTGQVYVMDANDCNKVLATLSEDSPCHFAKGKWSVADIPLQNFIHRPTAVIDVVAQSQVTRDYELSVDDIKEWEKENGEIPDGAVILVRTGWGRFWPQKLEYFGTDTKDHALLHFPGVAPTAAEWIIENRKIVGIGIDSPSIDNGQSPQHKSHQLFANKNIYHLENIAQTIHKLPPIGAKLTLLPLKIEGASGVPVTVIAEIDSTETSIASTSIATSLPALLLSLLAFETFRHIIS